MPIPEAQVGTSDYWAVTGLAGPLGRSPRRHPGGYCDAERKTETVRGDLETENGMSEERAAEMTGYGQREKPKAGFPRLSTALSCLP